MTSGTHGPNCSASSGCPQCDPHPWYPDPTQRSEPPQPDSGPTNGGR